MEMFINVFCTLLAIKMGFNEGFEGLVGAMTAGLGGILMVAGIDSGVFNNSFSKAYLDQTAIENLRSFSAADRIGQSVFVFGLGCVSLLLGYYVMRNASNPR